MGLFKNQAIDVIDYKIENPDVLIHKYDCHDDAIKIGAQLTVRPGQVAVFMKDGKVADVFEEGRYTLTTKNIPILSKLLNIPFGGTTPFKADVYFIDVTTQIDNKWGTTEPIVIRDKEFFNVRLRARGSYIYHVDNPEFLLTELAGSVAGDYLKSTFNKLLKGYVLQSFADIVATSEIPFLDLAMNYEEISTVLTEKIREKAQNYYVYFEDILIESVTLPEEVLKALDQKSSMGILGDMNQFTQFQAAHAMREAANNPNGGTANAGVGLGAGVMMGQQMMNAMNNGLNNNQGGGDVKVRCTSCSTPISENAKFCPSCGAKQGPATCANCNHELPAGTKFCPNCGTKA